MPGNPDTIGMDEVTWQNFKAFLTDNMARQRPVVAGKNIDPSIGDDTWYWPRYPMCKCKPMLIFTFEGGQQVFNTGSHIPLIVFIGDAKDSARGDQSWADRQGKAKNRRHKDGGGFDMPSVRRREKQEQESWKKNHGWYQQDEWSQPQWWHQQQGWDQHQRR